MVSIDKGRYGEEYSAKLSRGQKAAMMGKTIFYQKPSKIHG
jgi:hypothetical protein